MRAKGLLRGTMASRRTKSTSGKEGRGRRPGRPPYNSSHTRGLIMDVAEGLFATHGVEGVSIRSINTAARLNQAAVHYHFGSKDSLVEAIVRRRSDAALQRMTELLDAATAPGETPTVHGLVAAMATPAMELLDRDPVGGLRWGRLIARLLFAQDLRLSKLSGGPGMTERFTRALRQAFPDVSDARLDMAWFIAVATLIQMLANSGTPGARRAHHDGSRISKTYVDTLVRFVVCGLTGALVSS